MLFIPGVDVNECLHIMFCRCSAYILKKLAPMNFFFTVETTWMQFADVQLPEPAPEPASLLRRVGKQGRHGGGSKTGGRLCVPKESLGDAEMYAKMGKLPMAGIICAHGF